MGVPLPGWRPRLEASARGGYASERDAAEALERELERLRRERQVARSLTLGELVEAYLAQHDVEPVTIEKLRCLLGKAVAVFSRYMGASLTMIDRHYGHLARDGREYAIRLLDELGAGQRPRWTLVDAAWTPNSATDAQQRQRIIG